MFNSIKYAKVLEDAGLPRNQAETHIQVISDVLEGELVTKQDILELQSSIKNEFTQLESKFTRLENKVFQLNAKITSEVKRLETKITNEVKRLEAKIEKSEQNIIFKLGSLMVVLIGCVIGVLGFIFQNLH